MEQKLVDSVYFERLEMRNVVLEEENKILKNENNCEIEDLRKNNTNLHEENRILDTKLSEITILKNSIEEKLNSILNSRSYKLIEKLKKIIGVKKKSGNEKK